MASARLVEVERQRDEWQRESERLLDRLAAVEDDRGILLRDITILRARLAAVEAVLADPEWKRWNAHALAERVRAAARGEGDRPAPSSIVRLTGFQTQLDASRGEDAAARGVAQDG